MLRKDIQALPNPRRAIHSPRAMAPQTEQPPLWDGASDNATISIRIQSRVGGELANESLPMPARARADARKPTRKNTFTSARAFTARITGTSQVQQSPKARFGYAPKSGSKPHLRT